MEFIQLALDRVQWCAFLNMEMNIWFHKSPEVLYQLSNSLNFLVGSASESY
jgi:hypothetical protein